MLKKLILILFFTSSISNAADVSNLFSNLIPGEGLTEASIQINEDDNPDIEILALRDIDATNNSNLFTQFSIHTQETNGKDRLIGNIGIGYRKLSDDKTNMFGINMFFDNDFNAGHQRNKYCLVIQLILHHKYLMRHGQKLICKIIHGRMKKHLATLKVTV